MARNGYSVSSIETYQQCPRQFDAIYNKGIQRPPSDAMTFGSIIHKTLERWHSPTEPCQYESILDLYDEIWRKSSLMDFELYSQGKEMLESYISKPEHYANKTLAVELRFGLPDSEYHPKIGNYDLIGIIDRIDEVDEQTLELIDYKTGTYGFDISEASAKLQLLYYSYVVKQIFPQYRYHRVVYHYLRYGRLEVGTIDTEEPGVYDEFERYLLNLFYQIEHQQEWEPKVNVFCSTCHVRHDCPAYRAAIDRGEIPQIEDATTLAALWKRREELSHYIKMITEVKDNLEDLIKAWMQENNLNHVPLDDESGELVLEPYKSSKYPFDVVLALVGPDKIGDFVSVRKGDVDKYFKNNPDAMQILQASAVVTLGKPMLRFSPKRLVKAKKDGESQDA